MAQQQPPTPRRPGLPFSVALRGKTFVKGKGDVDTYWLVVHHHMLPQQQQQQPPSAGGQGFHAFHGGESAGPESPRTAGGPSPEASSDVGGDAAPASAVPASGSHGSVRRSMTYVVCHGTPPQGGGGGAPWTSVIPLPSPRDPLPAAAAGAASWPPFSLLPQNVSSSGTGAADDSARSASALARKPGGGGATVLAQHYLVKAQSGAPAGAATRGAGAGSGVFSAGSGTFGGVGSHSYRDVGIATARGVFVSVRPLVPIAPPPSKRRRSTRVIIDASGSLHNISSAEGSGVYTTGLPGTVPADAGSLPRTPVAAAAAVVVLPVGGGPQGLVTPRLTSQCFLQPIAYEGVGGDEGVRALRPPFRVSDASSTGTAAGHNPPGVVPSSSDPLRGGLSETTVSQPAFSPSIAAAAAAGGAAAGTVASGSAGVSGRSPTISALASGGISALASGGVASDQTPRMPLLPVPPAPRAPAPALSAGRGARRIAATLSLLRTSLEAGGGGGAALSPASPSRTTASPLSSSAGTSGAPLTIQERVALAKLSGSAARRSSWVERSISRNNFEGDASSPATGGRDRMSVDVEAMSRVGSFLASAVTGVHSELRSRTATRDYAFTGIHSELRSRTATREHYLLGGVQSDRTRTATREHHTVLTEVDPEAEVPVFTGQSQPEELVGVDIAPEQLPDDPLHFAPPRATVAQSSCDTLWDSLLYALSHEPFADPDAEAGLQTELLNNLVRGGGGGRGGGPAD